MPGGWACSSSSKLPLSLVGGAYPKHYTHDKIKAVSQVHADAEAQDEQPLEVELMLLPGKETLCCSPYTNSL